MATITLLADSWNTSSGTKAPTATPAVGDLIVLISAHTGNTSAAAPTDNNSGGAGTYTAIQTVTHGGGSHTMTLWVRTALIASATSTTFTHAPGGSSGGGLAVFNVTSMLRAGSAAVRQSAGQSEQTAATTPSLTLGGAVLTGNPVLGQLFTAANPAGVTPPTGWTELDDSGYGTPATGKEAACINSGFTGSTVTWGSTSAGAFCSVVAELDTSAPAPPPPLERWDVHEVTLTATTTYTNPFADLVLSATATHTDTSTAITIPGFYDGNGAGGAGNLWKLRFRPTLEGEWTWVSTASPTDATLHNQSGSFTAEAPSVDNHGPLVAASAPYLHFPHADGSTTFLVGLWVEQLYAFSASRRAEFLDFLLAQGIRRVRLYPPHDAKFPGGTNHDQFTLALFQAVDVAITEIQARGMICDLYLYGTEALYPMTQAQDERYIRYTLARYAAFRAVICTLHNQTDIHFGSYCNTALEITNSNAWANARGPYFQSINPYGTLMTTHHPCEDSLCTGGRTGTYLPSLDDWPYPTWPAWVQKQIQATALSTAADLTIQEPASVTLNERGLSRLHALTLQLRADTSQVVSVDEYSFEQDPTPAGSHHALSTIGTRKVHWVVTMAGAMGATKPAGLPVSGDFASDAALDTWMALPTVPQLGLVAQVMDPLPFAAMVPENSLVSAANVSIGGTDWRSNWCLAQAGVAYLVYSLNGGSGTVTLPAGSYTGTQINPRTAAETDLGTVSGGSVGFTLPSLGATANHNTADSDWLLRYLFIAAGASRPDGRWTQLSALGTPGGVQTFSAKTPAAGVNLSRPMAAYRRRRVA